MDPSHSWVQSHNRLWFQRGPRRQTPPGWCRGLAWKQEGRVDSLQTTLSRHWQALGGASRFRGNTSANMDDETNHIKKKKEKRRKCRHNILCRSLLLVCYWWFKSCKFKMSTSKVCSTPSRHLVAAKTLELNFVSESKWWCSTSCSSVSTF